MKTNNQYSDNLLKEIYSDPNLRNVESLIDYLDLIGGKKLKKAFIRQILFKYRWQEREQNLLYRCHVQAASIYLRHLLDSKRIINIDEIRIVIADIANIIGNLDRKQNVSFIVLSTNVLPSPVHYKQAETLFYKHILPEKKNRNYDFDLLVLYALRLSLEKRIHGFLGIDYILTPIKPISLSKLIKISKRLQSIEYSNDIRWIEIEWVNNWLNHFMHRHLRPHPWIIHQAFEVLNTILLPSSITKGTKTTNSFYAATYVKDYQELKKEFESILKNEYNEIDIQWSMDHELVKEK